MPVIETYRDVTGRFRYYNTQNGMVLVNEDVIARQLFLHYFVRGFDVLFAVINHIHDNGIKRTYSVK